MSGSYGGVIIIREVDIVGDGDGNVEGGEEDEVILDSFGDVVVEEEVAGFFYGGYFVFGY